VDVVTYARARACLERSALRSIRVRSRWIARRVVVVEVFRLMPGMGVLILGGWGDPWRLAAFAQAWAAFVRGGMRYMAPEPERRRKE
jgi:hypothetical protein